MVIQKNSENGALALPLVFLASGWVVASLLLVGLLHDWHEASANQLRIDACAGKAALALQKDLNRIEKSNLRIQAIRVEAMAMPDPVTRAGLIAASTTLAIAQDLLVLAWRGRSIGWAALQGCARRGDLSRPVQAMTWIRLPPDQLGPQPLRWLDGASTEIVFRVQSKGRIAWATVWRQTQGIENEWKANWGNRAGFLGSGHL